LRLGDLFIMSFDTLRNNWLRTILTVLGITIGIAALTATFTLMEGTNETVNKTMASFGGKFMVVYPEYDDVLRVPKGKPFDLEDAQAVAGISGVSMVSLQKSNWWVPVRYEMQPMHTDIYGTDPNFAVIRNRRVEKGRFINLQDVEHQRRVCVITEGIKKRFFPSGDYIGKKLEINGVLFEIIGCLEPMLLPTTFGTGQEEGDLYTPITTSQNLFGEYHYETIFLRYDKRFERFFEKKRNLKLLKGRISKILRFRKGEGSEYVLQTLDDMAEQQKKMALTISIALCSIAALCLVVGGIGIMNIMLVSVMERTREIGIRKAVGARSQEILNQFLVEALSISAIGGIAGLLLGIVGSRIVAIFVGMPVRITWWIILLGAGCMLLIGVGFGLFPAKKAASVEPIECLRYE
jgi:putative ABC transport system permease protein